MDIWNLPHVEDGDTRYIRKEYTEVTNLDKEGDSNEQDNGNSNVEGTEAGENNTNENNTGGES